MKTFKDLDFQTHPNANGLQATHFFPNGYGVSVVRFKAGGIYGSYTNGESDWELAVLKGNKKKWSLTYNTPITEDVLGYLSEKDVTDTMKKIQSL